MSAISVYLDFLYRNLYERNLNANLQASRNVHIRPVIFVVQIVVKDVGARQTRARAVPVYLELNARPSSGLSIHFSLIMFELAIDILILPFLLRCICKQPAPQAAALRR